MSNTCLKVIPGHPPSPWQKAGLGLVANLQGKRDVVLAIDVTSSVNFNQEGQIYLDQIVKDGLDLRNNTTCRVMSNKRAATQCLRQR